MPAHDWTRVSAGIFHDFHNAWITEIRNALNGGILPPDYYALGEQSAGAASPDVLTLHSNAPEAQPPPNDVAVGTAVAVAPPQVRFTAALEMDVYTPNGEVCRDVGSGCWRAQRLKAFRGDRA